jgi:hypothetical protein
LSSLTWFADVVAILRLMTIAVDHLSLLHSDEFDIIIIIIIIMKLESYGVLL